MTTSPATQSPEMIRVIRDDIGFGGLLMTDDLNMQALSGDLADRTARSMAAGCDSPCIARAIWPKCRWSPRRQAA